METLYFKEQDETVHKITCEYVDHQEDPRKYASIGYMVFKERRNESLGDEQVKNYGDFFINNLPGEDKEQYQSMTENQLFNLWEKEQLIVIPLNIIDHGRIAIHEGSLAIKKERWLDGSLDENVVNDGFIYIPKDSDFVTDFHLQQASPEKILEVARKYLMQELAEYTHYVNGEVYRLKDEVFNKSTLGWDTVEEYSPIYEDVDDFIKAEFGVPDFIHDRKEIQQMESTITPEYVEATGKKFFKEIEQCLSDFDGNLLYAQKSVFNAWNREGANDLFPNKIKLTALSQFLKNNGCNTSEATLNFIGQNINPSQIKEFDPFSPDAAKDGYETYLLPNWNKYSSNYKSRTSPEHALIVDKANKRFGILSKAYTFSGDRLPSYKDKPLMTRKKFIEKINELHSYGLHFEKFTGKNASYSQGRIEDFLSGKDKKKTINVNGRER